MECLPDPEAEREWVRIFFLHFHTWFDGGSLEDIPEKDRDPSVWEIICYYRDAIMEMVEKEVVDGSEELPAADIDFTRDAGVDEDTIRDQSNRTSGPNIPHKP